MQPTSMGHVRQHTSGSIVTRHGSPSPSRASHLHPDLPISTLSFLARFEHRLPPLLCSGHHCWPPTTSQWEWSNCPLTGFSFSVCLPGGPGPAQPLRCLLFPNKISCRSKHASKGKGCFCVDLLDRATESPLMEAIKRVVAT